MEIFAVKVNENMDQARVDRLSQIFDSKKREAISMMKAKHARLAAVTSAFLIRHIVKIKLGLCSEEIVFVENMFGKPQLVGKNDFHFNLSRSGDWVVCAIDCEPIGIDIEKIDYKHPKMILEVLSLSEIKIYEKLGVKDKTSFFYEIWTRKESYAKALGVGLNMALNTVTVYVENENDIFSPIVGDEDDKRYFLKRYSMDGDYAMNVCAMNENFAENIIFIDDNDLFEI